MDAAFTPAGGRGILVPAPGTSPPQHLPPARRVPPGRPARPCGSVPSLCRSRLRAGPARAASYPRPLSRRASLEAMSIVPMVRMRAVIP